MNKILVIAKNTFREAIRDRILYALVGFGALFSLFDLFIAKVALQDIVIVKAVGLSGIYVFGILITIFLGASIIYKEIERRTLYFVLSKPVSRTDVILGKFAGLSLAVVLTTLLMAAVYLGVVGYESGGLDLRGLEAIMFQILEAELFVALLIFFSSVAAPLTSTLCAAVILFVGHLLPGMLAETSRIGGAAHAAVSVLYYTLPNLEKFDLRNAAIHGLATPENAALLAIGYAVLYATLLLTAAVALFKRREL